MIPFGVKILWFVLSLTGLISSWVVLIPFGSAVGAMWGPLNFCIGNTMLQGIFCLGMIWKMDPFLMPRGFCIAQTIIIGSATFLLTGITGAFSMATSLTVLKPRRWDDHITLQWRKVFWVPVLVFPVAATIAHVVVLVRLDSVKPTDDLHCDSSNPLWVRFLGYAGLPFLVTVPCAYLSLKSLVRIYKTNQHINRVRGKSSSTFNITGGNPNLPPQSVDKKDDTPGYGYNPPLLASTVTNVMTRSPSLASSNEYPPGPRSVGSSPFLMDGQWPPTVERKFHLPFRPPLEVLERSPAVSLAENQKILEEDDTSDVSSTLPRFLPLGVSGKGKQAGFVPGREDVVNARVVSAGMSREDRDGEVYPGFEGEQLEIKAGNRTLKVDARDSGNNYVFGEAISMDRISEVNVAPSGYRSQPSLLEMNDSRSLPSLAPAIWRMILFQTAFCVVQILTCISTIVDLARRSPTPTPLGTQHFALLLAAWGPAIVFGHTPAVRKSLKFWHRQAPVSS